MQSKWIEGYEGKYKITDNAEVVSYVKDHNGKVLKPHLNKNGYLTVELLGNEVKLHQLVASAFVDGKAPGLVPNHKDGNKQNCLPSNLEWVTHSENTKHAYDNGLCPKQKGPRVDNRCIVQLTLDGAVVNTYDSITEAARATKPDSMKLTSAVSKIKQVCEGYTYNGYTRKTAYGYRWSYAD